MVKVIRQTKQKKEFQEIVHSFGSFFNAQEVSDKSSLPLATIYRHLKDLVDQGELYSYQCAGRAIYSIKKRSHCHFVCEKTGKVIHFDVDSLDFLKNKIPGDIDSFQIEVRGVCDDICKGDHSC